MSNEAEAHRVSVVIPAYNGARFIGEAVASVLAQTLPPREIVVVDDASTDDTADIVASLAGAAAIPIRLIRLGRNSGGPACPINIGVSAASGDLIAVCDQDDLLHPEKLACQARVLSRHPEMTLAFSLSGFTDRRGVTRQSEAVMGVLARAGRDEGGHRRLDPPAALHMLIEQGNFIVGYPGFLFRRRDWARKGGVDEGLRIASDYDLLCWLCTLGPVAYLPVIHYFRRIHGENLSRWSIANWAESIMVKARYLGRDDCMLRDRVSSSKLLGEFLGFAYWAREAGDFPRAIGAYCRALGIWGFDPAILTAAAKLPPHLLLKMARRCGPGCRDAGEGMSTQLGQREVGRDESPQRS